MSMPQSKSSKQDKGSSPGSKNNASTSSRAESESDGTGLDKSEKMSGEAQAKEGPNEVGGASGGEDKMCRYCFCGTEEGELISPCQCKGGQRYVHLHCLRRWQRMVLVSQPTYPVSFSMLMCPMIHLLKSRCYCFLALL